VRIFFPDPWHKKRHYKRRLIQPDFVTTLARTLKPEGVLRIATDWGPYAEWIRECVAAEQHFQPQLDTVRSAEDPCIGDSTRAVLTNFERRGERLGHDIHDLVYVKIAQPRK
jgi:tRNA (guanine-N7-)-methyltransferase